MTKKNWTKTGLKVAGFGTAMAAAANAQYAEATIVNLNFKVDAGGVGAPNSVIYQFGSQLVTLFRTDNNASIGKFRAYNSSQNATQGKAFKQGTGTLQFNSGLAATLAGNLVSGPFINGIGAVSVMDNNYRFAGFLLQNSPNERGWIKFKWDADLTDPIILVSGAFTTDHPNDQLVYGTGGGGSTGGSSTGGGGAVPEPSSLAAFAGLGALALGAAGLKKRRVAETV